MPIRQLQEADLERITFIAHVGLEFDEVNAAVLREKTVGARNLDVDLSLAYEEGDKVVGFIQGSVGKPAEGKLCGHVRMFVVDPAYRNQGIGGKLLAELESRLKKIGVQEVSIMDDPANYFMPGLDFRYTEGVCFLLKHGYTKVHENHNLLCDLSIDAWPQLADQVKSLADEGVEIRRATQADGEDIHAFLDGIWPGWHIEVANALENDPVSLFIARHEGKTIAFSGYQGNNRGLSWFGPMGTLPVLRGKGIGGILLRLCLQELAKQGYRKAIIPWVGPTRFYSRLCGARLDRCFYVFRKSIQD